jgi:NTE family protein
VDGGIVSLVPAGVARRQGADTVIAVVVEKDILQRDEFHTGKEIADRATEVMSRRLVDYDLRQADIVIRPDVADLEWSDFSQALSLVDAGVKATEEKLPAIRKSISRLTGWFPVKRILRNILEE